MRKIANLLLLGSALAGYVAPVMAADIPEEPPVVIEPEQPPVIIDSSGGWYIRGDVDYSWMKNRGANYSVPLGSDLVDFTTAESDPAFSLGGGIGYQVTKHLRVDATLDYEFKADFRGSTTGDCTVGLTSPGSCTSVDTSSHSTLLLMANAYVDLGNYHGFTPYVGGGLGLAHVKWSDLTNVATCTAAAPDVCDQTYPGYVGNASGGSYTEVHGGAASWRGAMSLMAGASYDLTSNLKLDAGYKFTHVYGGPMFNYVGGSTAQGYDKGFNIHSVRAGLRYQFGGGSSASYDSGPVYK